MQLAPEQAEFTALPSQLLPMLEGNPERLGVTILENDVPVGLFALSVGEHRDKYLPQPDPAGVALGALSLDRRCQGRGVGSAAMRQLSDFVPRHFPSAQHVLLVVNQRNPAAKHVYEKVGFVVLREREGLRGPQWVMQLDLSSPAPTS
ncbi:GNAT family N-acetyltransferase [Deinococcus xinjiangensis]|uniref:GNAT family N-acetyltransferase n=1 Tax=Deinococcus xinjiangensis TaxID=457454 RepID=UPI0033657113